MSCVKDCGTALGLPCCTAQNAAGAGCQTGVCDPSTNLCSSSNGKLGDLCNAANPCDTDAYAGLACVNNVCACGQDSAWKACSSTGVCAPSA